MLRRHFVFFHFSLMVKTWSQVEILRKHAAHTGIAY